MNTRTLFVAAVVAAVPALYAQEEKKTPGGVAMPNPKQKEHDALKALVGTWDVTMKVAAVPGVPGMEKATEAQRTEVSELVCNGLWLKTSMDGTWLGEPCQGLRLTGYDPIGKTYVDHYVYSEDCGPSTWKGTYDAKTKTWTWTRKTRNERLKIRIRSASVDWGGSVGLDHVLPCSTGPTGIDMVTTMVNRPMRAPTNAPFQIGESLN